MITRMADKNNLLNLKGILRLCIKSMVIVILINYQDTIQEYSVLKAEKINNNLIMRKLEEEIEGDEEDEDGDE